MVNIVMALDECHWHGCHWILFHFQCAIFANIFGFVSPTLNSALIISHDLGMGKFDIIVLNGSRILPIYWSIKDFRNVKKLVL